MERCERFEADISAMLDGELQGEALLKTLDHLTRCQSCRRFYTDARELQKLVSPGKNLPGGVEFPGEMWDEILRCGEKGSRGIFRLTGPTTRILAVAAMILLAVGLWLGGVFRLPDLRASDDVIQVNLGEDRGKMTEDRFITLTAELLKADPRYHRKMLEVLEAVNQGNFIAEGSLNAGRASEKLPDESPADGEKVPANRYNRGKPSNPVEISFW